MTRLLALLLALFVVLSAAPSVAQTTAERSAEADNLFAQGKAAAQSENWQRAYELFSSAFALKSSYDIAGNLGQAAFRTGRNVEAAKHLQYCLEHFPATGDPKQRQAIEEIFAATEKKVATVRIRTKPDTATVTIDGTKRQPNSLGVVYVEPGRWSVEISSEGYEAMTQKLSVTAGKTHTIEAELQPEATDTLGTDLPVNTPPPTSPTGIPEEDGASWVPAYVGGGLTLVGLGVGTAFLLRSNADRDDFKSLGASLPDDGCTAPDASSRGLCNAIRRKTNDADRSRNIGRASLIAGGLAGVATVSYVVWAASKNHSTALQLAPTVVGTGGTVSVTGSF